ncbi:MAG: OmpA family protein [Proteobacteria bacterium]|nr:OmpA family protein [Pseudomonadota bacterium]
MIRKTLLYTLLAALWATVPGSLRADEAPIDVNRFHPALGSETIMTTDLAAVGPNWQLVPQLFLHYADTPMVLTFGGEPDAKLVTNRLTGELGISLSLLDRLQIGLSFPVTLNQGSDSFAVMPIFDGPDSVNPPDDISSTGPEDLRLSAKTVLWRDGPWGAGAVGYLTAPTGDGDSYLGSKMPTFEARAIGHYKRGRLTAGASLGWLFASTEQVLTTRTGMALTFGAGAEYRVYRNSKALSVALAAELFGLIHSRFDTMREAPAELLVAAKSHYEQWTFYLGGGPGLTRGYGEPNVRVLVGASYRWRRSPPPPPPAVTPQPVRIADLDADPPAQPEPEPEPEPEPKPPATWVDSTLTLPSGVLFEYDKCQIKPESFATLRRVAESLSENPEWGKVRIEGHASKENNRAKYNLRLSRCRAERVVRFLAYYGVDRARLSFLGFGYSCPRAANDTEENRKENRRVEFVRNPADNPPRCTVPKQIPPLPKHASEPYLYETGKANQPGQSPPSGEPGQEQK